LTWIFSFRILSYKSDITSIVYLIFIRKLVESAMMFYMKIYLDIERMMKLCFIKINW